MQTQHWAGFSVRSIPTIWWFLLIFSLLYPAIRGEGRATCLEIKTLPNSPTKLRKSSGKLLFVTDFWMCLSTEQPPPFNLSSLVSRSFLSFKIQQKTSLEAKLRENPPFFPGQSISRGHSSIPGSGWAVWEPCPACPGCVIVSVTLQIPFPCPDPGGKINGARSGPCQ